MNRTFRFADLERSGRGAKTRHTARLADAKGVERYELVVAGAPALLKRAFADATIKVEIDPSTDKKTWAKELGVAWRQQQESQSPVSSLEDVPALFKKKAPPVPTAAKSGFVSLRKLEPGGTRYRFTITGLTVPVLMSFFFPLPPVCTTAAVVVPASGDQDLFLHLGWPPIGPIMASINGGTTVDALTFAFPCTIFTHFGPIWQLFGFRTGVCGTFTYSGIDIGG